MIKIEVGQVWTRKGTVTKYKTKVIGVGSYRVLLRDLNDDEEYSKPISAFRAEYDPPETFFLPGVTYRDDSDSGRGRRWKVVAVHELDGVKQAWIEYIDPSRGRFMVTRPDNGVPISERGYTAVDE